MHQPISQAERSAVERWLTDNLLDVLKQIDDWHLHVTDMPDGIGRSDAVSVKKIESIQSGSIRLLSLAQGELQATVKADVKLAMYISAEDCESSPEAREWVGEREPGFIGCHLDFNAPVALTLDLKFLKEPPMVLSHTIRKVEGGSRTTTFSKPS